ncbi:MAG: zinc-ribbon domain-containing protein, partial [Clostridia bacterium]|nr:zinc-ribbon domain-containing protein [Clostridia bacterium]
MPFCPNCGSPVEIDDRFCGNCGTALKTGVAVTEPAARSDFRIVLLTKGDCRRAVAVDMISDLLGYSDDDAAKIIDNTPMEIAKGLTAIQAQYLCQALTEYDMQVAIFNSDGYVDLGEKATSSVFDGDGSFLNTVASVLAGLTLGNRISSYSRWTRPAPVVFKPTYRRTALRPDYRRRRPAPRPTQPGIPVIRQAVTAVPDPVPRPAPRPAQRPAPVPAQRPAPTPAQRPAPVPAQRPAPTPAQRPAPVPAQRPA